MIPTFLDNAFLKNKACRLKYKITKSKKKKKKQEFSIPRTKCFMKTPNISAY